MIRVSGVRVPPPALTQAPLGWGFRVLTPIGAGEPEKSDHYGSVAD